MAKSNAVKALEKEAQRRDEERLKIRDSKEEIMEKYKENLPQIMEEKINDIAKVLQETETMDGLSIMQINEMLRGKSYYITTPTYTADELMVVFESYRRAIIEINKATKYIPSKENFCAFAGIATTTYNQYLLGADEDKSNVVVLIEDYIKETMLSLAQLGEIKEVTTIFRGKASHGMIEAQAPQVIEHVSSHSLEQINKLIKDVKSGKSLK